MRCVRRSLTQSACKFMALPKERGLSTPNRNTPPKNTTPQCEENMTELLDATAGGVLVSAFRNCSDAPFKNITSLALSGFVIMMITSSPFCLRRWISSNVARSTALISTVFISTALISVLVRCSANIGAGVAATGIGTFASRGVSGASGGSVAIAGVAIADITGGACDICGICGVCAICGNGSPSDGC